MRRHTSGPLGFMIAVIIGTTAIFADRAAHYALGGPDPFNSLDTSRLASLDADTPRSMWISCGLGPNPAFHGPSDEHGARYAGTDGASIYRTSQAYYSREYAEAALAQTVHDAVFVYDCEAVGRGTTASKGHVYLALVHDAYGDPDYGAHGQQARFAALWVDGHQLCGIYAMTLDDVLDFERKQDARGGLPGL